MCYLLLEIGGIYCVVYFWKSVVITVLFVYGNRGYLLWCLLLEIGGNYCVVCIWKSGYLLCCLLLEIGGNYWKPDL